jgi:hypothetical protein
VDAEARKRRREAARQRTRRQRRLVLAGALGLVGLVLLAFVLGGAGGDRGEPDAAGREAGKPAELPGGGREILPRSQVVGFYGAPQDEELGALGVGTPDQAGRRLRAQAKRYERRGGRPVLPAFELIAVVAANAPGEDGKYRTRQSGGVIRRYLAAARRAGAILILDIQPGRADFIGEVERLRPFLEEPDVSLALDPEWHVGPGELPGQVIGSVDAGTVNRAAAMLSEIVREHRLPQKLLLVHQFTGDMIQRRGQLEQPPGVAVTVNVDGFGDRPNKLSKYEEFTSARPRFHNGFKLFYKEDTNLLGPRDVMRMRPRPEVVVYE